MKPSDLLIIFAGPIAMTIAGLLIWGAAGIGLIP